jgi:hypothetical protein
VRQARVPSIAALNPEIEAELEAVVRKALARDPNDRYQTANDLVDALTQYLFSRRMKVTARDIAALVRDTQVENMRKRSAEPKDSLIDALIVDEMQKMTSLVEGEEGSGAGANGATAEGSMSLDPSTFVDTSGWAGEMGLQGSGQHQPPPQFKRPTKPPATKSNRTNQTPPAEAVESLEQMLEPDRTGVHGKATGPTKPLPWVPIIIMMVVLAAGAAVAVVFAMR